MVSGAPVVETCGRARRGAGAAGTTCGVGALLRACGLVSCLCGAFVLVRASVCAFVWVCLLCLSGGLRHSTLHERYHLLYVFVGCVSVSLFLSLSPNACFVDISVSAVVRAKAGMNRRSVPSLGLLEFLQVGGRWNTAAQGFVRDLVRLRAFRARRGVFWLGQALVGSPLCRGPARRCEHGLGLCFHISAISYSTRQIPGRNALLHGRYIPRFPTSWPR